jgi:hypothetical protein
MPGGKKKISERLKIRDKYVLPYARNFGTGTPRRQSRITDFLSRNPFGALGEDGDGSHPADGLEVSDVKMDAVQDLPEEEDLVADLSLERQWSVALPVPAFPQLRF